MGTPQNDTWAGWAISSFTNKIATANGEMQPKPGPAKMDPRAARPSSVPPITDANRPASKVASASQLHRQAVTGPSQPVLIRTSTDQFFGDAQEEDDEIDDAWGNMDEDSFFDAPTQHKSTATLANSVTPAAFDDGGEPDFEGWLKAQAQAKAKPPLPKGLSKSSNSSNGRQDAARSITAGQAGPLSSRRIANTTSAILKNPLTKAIDTKPKELTADDEWGDAWD